MARGLRGITVKLGGDTSELKRSLNSAEKETKGLAQELKGVNSLLKLDPKNVTLLKQKEDILKKSIEETARKQKDLNEVLKKVDSGDIKMTETEYRNLQREIELTEQKQRNLKKELKNFGSVGAQKVKALGENFKNAGEKISGAGKKLLPVTGVIVGAGAAAVKTSADFESAMSKVAATMGMTADEINNGATDYKTLEEAARNMGAETKYSAAEAADALNYLALAGYDVQKSVDTLPTVLSLAAAGDMDLAAAADMVTDSMSALGKSAGSADSFVDKMAKTAQKSNTTVSMLGEAILTVGGTANYLKGGVTELDTAVGLLANTGIKGAEGGTKLRNIILSLVSPTDKAKKTLQELGVSATDEFGNLRSLNDIFGDLNKSLKGMGSADKAATLKKIFNKADLKGVNSLMKQSGKEFNNLSKEIDGAQGTAKKMSDTMQNNLGGQITKLKSALSEAGISIGKALLPVIKKLVGFIQDLTDKFNKLSPSAKNTILIIAGIAAAIGPALIVIGKLATGIGAVMGLAPRIVSFISTFKTAIVSLFNVMMAHPVGALVAVLGILAATIVGVIVATRKSTDAEKDSMQARLAHINKIREETEEIRKQNDELDENYEKLTETMQGDTSRMEYISNLATQLDGLADAEGRVNEKDRAQVDFILNELNGALGTEYELVGNQIKQYQELKNSIQDVINAKTAQMLLSDMEENYTEATKNYQKAQEEANKAYNKQNKAIIKTEQEKYRLYQEERELERQYQQEKTAYGLSMPMSVTAEYNRKRDLLAFQKKANKAERESAEEKYNALKDKASKYYASIIKYQAGYQAAAKGNSKKAQKILTGDIKEYQAIGKHITNGVATGMTSEEALAACSNAAGVIADTGIKELKKKLGIKSPSIRAKKEVGKFIALGVVEGVKSESKNVGKSAEQLANLYISAARTKVSTLRNSNKLTLRDEISFWRAIRAQCVKGSTGYKTAVNEIAKAKKNYLNESKKINKDYSSDVKSLKKSLVSDIKTVTDKYSDAVKSRKEAITSSLNLDKALTVNSKVTKESLTEILSNQVEKLKEWDSTLDRLRNREGMSKGLLSDLEEMGVENLDTIKSFEEMTDEELSAYVKLYNKRNKIALDRSKTENAELEKSTKKQINKLISTANTKLDKLEAAYNKKLKKIGASTRDTSVSIGKNIVKGLIKGVKSSDKSFQAYLTAFFGSISSNAKTALKTGKTSTIEQQLGTKSKVPKSKDVNSLSAPAAAQTDNSSIDILTEVVAKLSEKIDKMKIILDDGTLVGVMSTKMDTKFSDIAAREARGMS